MNQIRSKEPAYQTLEVPKTSLIGNLLVAINYVWTDTKKNKKSFLIGCFAVTLVVFATTLLQNTVQNSPMIFLKVAENTLGEYDMTLWPSVIDTNEPRYYVNATEVQQKLKDLDEVSGVFPRIILVSNVLNTVDNRNGTGIILGIDSAKEKGIIGREWTSKPLVGSSAHVSSSLLRMIGVKPNKGEKITLLFDFITLASSVQGTQTDKELVQAVLAQIQKNIELTANKTTLKFDIDGIVEQLEKFTTLPPQSQQIIALLKTDFVQQQLGKIILGWLASRGFSKEVIFEKGTELTDEQFQQIKTLLSLSIDLTVEDGIDKPNGKFPEALGNVVLVEIDYLNQFAKEQMRKLLQEAYDEITKLTIVSSFIQRPYDNAKSFIEKFDSREFSMITVVMYTKRLTAFLLNREQMDELLNVWANSIGNALGANYPVLMQIPLVKTLQILYYLRLFLDQLLTVVELFLMFVGMYLIYALLLADVEARVYEMGMLRALGMEKYTLIEIVVLESTIFSVPGISFGLALALLAFQPVRYYLEWYTAIPVSFGLDPLAIAMGTILGSLMPLVSIIGPIKRALSKTLRDALDLYHSLTNDVKVTFTYLEDLGLSPEQTSLSALAVVIGFVIYYLVPYSFVFLYLALFFNIFVAIIMGMILGLALLGMVYAPSICISSGGPFDYVGIR